MKSSIKILGATFLFSFITLLFIQGYTYLEVQKVVNRPAPVPMSLHNIKMTASLLDSTSTFEDFSTTNTLPLLPVGTIDGQSGWSVRDDCDGVQKLYVPSVTYDEQIVDLGGNKVWRLSNAIVASSYRTQPFTPIASAPAGETGACTWNKRGSVPPMTNSTCQNTPLTCGRTADSDKFYGTFKFKSATGAAQPGLAVVVSPSAKQSTLRYSYVQIKDSGSGLDLYFVETLLSGTFSSSIPLVTGLSYTDWHTIQIDMKFYDGLNGDGTGNDCVGIYVDGNLVNTGTTWETYYKSAEPVGGSPKPRAVDSLLFRVSSAAAGTLGNGLYFDDVSITTDASDIPTNLTCTQIAPPQVCGNGIIEGTEVCEGGTQSCKTTNGSNGTQVCNSECSYDPCVRTVNSRNMTWNTIAYIAGPGGTISGNTVQEIAQDQTGTEVIAVPDAGHTFINWSDQVTTPNRIDNFPSQSMTLTAYFSPEPGQEIGGDAELPATTTVTTPVSTSTATSTVTKPPVTPPTPGTPNNPGTSIGNSSLTCTLSKNLGMDDDDLEVRCLQQFLNNNSFILGPSGPGSPGYESTFFGGRTKNALIRFQEKYANPILTRVNSSKATGYFGTSTRDFINSF